MSFLDTAVIHTMVIETKIAWFWSGIVLRAPLVYAGLRIAAYATAHVR